MATGLKLATPSSFPAFPFLPYDIQLNLMQHLYSAIEERKITIVESPTGTGKTLSLLCSSLSWLRDEQERARRGELDANGDELDWVVAQTLDRKRREQEANDLEYVERLKKARKKELLLRKAAKGRVYKRQKVSHEPEEEDQDDSQFLPESDQLLQDEEDNISPAVRALMKKLYKPDDSKSKEEELACTKIYYASRTHSQLSQVLHELRKLKISLAVTVAGIETSENEAVLSGSAKRPISAIDDTTDLVDTVDTRTVSLGSRKQLCVNEKLKAKAGDLDEACRQRLSEKGDRRCQYLPPVDDEVRMLDFRDQVLATPKDIEDLVEAGQNAQTCPYFGARRAIPQAQLVLLPYNLLLQKAARESLGIDLTNQVVIIDEAHNLISTLLSLSTVHLALRTLATSLHQLSIYLSKFRNRLSTTNSLHLKRLIGLLEALSKYATDWGEQQKNAVRPSDGNPSQKSASETSVMTSAELMDRLGQKVQGINFLEVEAYLRKSKIARKISGYCVKELEKAAGQDPVKLSKLSRLASSTPPLHTVESFILALTTASDDGRVTFAMNDGQVEIKYQHLNPSTHFQEVVNAARSVILAGGTMSPISDVTNQLFSTLSEDRFTTFSCGHIIPSSNLQTLILKKGPRGGELQFKYDRRNDQSMIAELGQIIVNFSNIVPGGMVVFVPSYSFLHLVISAWERSGIMDKFRAKKKVFMEPQESSAVEATLRDYSAEILDQSRKSEPVDTSKRPGAILFAVIGAKLSEGLNFTDDLARAVLVVGLPFANLASPELRERMNYVNRLQQSRGSKAAPGMKNAATELYENMCMNAVNQSIGRAIRHRGDWASLVLIDGRYSTPRIRQKLPKWIGEHTMVTETFGEAMKEMSQFYREKRSTVGV
ncbi:DNA repair helicase [Cristinia sonorae]|uniref:ATP-dependent DNA helicase CHL1 n=1 Tax=Cristinia sonorae TaxID=1940300 RepID=A0A8K0UT22_9AGAR|nr:DNA repair helicase [Cristinia sonorae]